jgi:hypothetical protein
MATTNVTITSQWQLVVSAGDSFLLTFNGKSPVQVAVADSTPSGIEGHRITPITDDGINRDVIGLGDVYCRLDPSVNGTVLAVVTTWTE